MPADERVCRRLHAYDFCFEAKYEIMVPIATTYGLTSSYDHRLLLSLPAP